jgi:hypothetical protein
MGNLLTRLADPGNRGAAVTRLNPFTARPSDKGAPAGPDGHVVKPAGKLTIQMPGRQLSIHCYEANWDLQAMGERDMREAEDGRRSGMTRGRGADQPRPRGSGERP